VDFGLTAEQQRLQHECQELAADFATRSAAHDRDASHPVENYDRLREHGFLALTVAKKWGGSGASFLDHTIAYEALGAGCPSTALAFNMVGEDVLITGAGPIGIMAVAIARFVGARHVVITDVNDYRLELARKMGASRAINIGRESLDQTMTDLDMQEGFDVGLEMSGNAAALRELLRTMHHGGSVAILGIPPEETAIDWNQVIFKGLTLKGIYGREMFETWYKMSSLLQSGLSLAPIITHHFGIEDYIEGFETMGSGQSGKVILDWAA